jgi:hypothetical protein
MTCLPPGTEYCRLIGQLEIGPKAIARMANAQMLG